MHSNAARSSATVCPTGWKASDARAAFLAAFNGKYDKPAWFRGIEFAPPPHDAQHHIATVFCGPHTARIKVLPNHRAIEGFTRDYPHAKALIIVIESIDSDEDIRNAVFSEIERLLK